MGLTIIYGRSGCGKTNYLFNNIVNNLNNGRKKFIITPEQFSFTAEKQLLNQIKEKANSIASVTAEVLTFDRMAHRVASEVGGTTKVALSDSGKAMIIYDLLSKNKNNLKFLNKSDSNIDLILTQLTELKKHGVSLENLHELITQVEDNRYLQEKLNDIYTIYSQYEEKIANEYIDESDDLTRLANQLEKTNLFADSEIYIDEFAGFTKQEYKIIEELMKVANSVAISVCTDSIDSNSNPDTDVFYSNKQMVKNIIKIAKEQNIKEIDEVYLSENKRAKNEELLFLEKNIASVPYDIYENDVKNIKIFLAQNQYAEIENVAKNIIELVRDGGYCYKDISIMTQNIDTYSSLCKAIFSQYNIPLYIDNRKKLNDNILVKYLISVLDIYAQKWSNESVINYLKTGLTPVSEEEVFLLEKYAKKWNIRGNKWYKEDWHFYDEDEFEDENIEKVNTLRTQIVEPLIDLKEKLTGTKTARQISENLYSFIIKNEVEKKVNSIIDNLQEIGELDIAEQYETSWKIIMSVLDEIIMVFGDEKITFEEYVKVLRVGFNNCKLGTIPMRQDEVVIGDVDRSRSHKVKTVFVIGLNDGSFPEMNKSEGFLNDNDRENIKEKGIELAKGTLEQIYDDNFNTYKAFSTAEEKLFLSYSSTNSEGKSLRTSIILNKVKKIFPKIYTYSDIINEEEHITTKENMFNSLLANIRKYEDGEEIDPLWFNVYQMFQEDEWKEKLDRRIEGISTQKKAEKISYSNIEKIYGNALKTSISRLEQYRSCPFSYFVKYDLKLNEKDMRKVETLDTGSFMHDIIDSFFSYIDENEIDIKQISDSQIESIIDDIVEEKLQLKRNAIFSMNEKYKNLVGRLKKVIKTSMKYIIQSIKQSSFEVLGHEVEFGQNKKFKSIIIPTSNGKKVEITGKIDRIDIAKNQDGTYVRIIDYKSSVKNIDLNKVMAGIQIQLLTYLNETCREEDFLPAGVLYFDLANPHISATKNMSEEEIANEIKKKFRMTGLVLADVNIIKMMDNKVAQNGGASDLVPGGLTSKGELSKSQGLISSQQFEHLQKYMDKIIKQISEEILNGNIEAKPYYNLKANKGKTPCEYCKYKSICGFDAGNKQNSYQYIGTLKKEDVIEKIKNELAKG